MRVGFNLTVKESIIHPNDTLGGVYRKYFLGAGNTEVIIVNIRAESEGRKSIRLEASVMHDSDEWSLGRPTLLWPWINL